MRGTLIVIATALVLAALALVAWASLALQAQLSLFQAQLTVYGDPPRVANPGPQLFATGAQPPLGEDPVVYVTSEPTAEEARTWVLLRRHLPVRLETETPLIDAIESIQQGLRDQGEGGEPLRIYFDQNGFEEVDQTPRSTVKIDQEDLEVSSALKRMLDQLGLVFTVDRDGLVVITSPESATEGVDPAPILLTTLTALRRDVAALRWEVAALRLGADFPRRPASRGGPFGGMLGRPPRPASPSQRFGGGGSTPR